MSMLFGQANLLRRGAGFVVRQGANVDWIKQAGLIEELLSPDLTDDFEVVHSTFKPGGKLEAPVSRPTQRSRLPHFGTSRHHYRRPKVYNNAR